MQSRLQPDLNRSNISDKSNSRQSMGISRLVLITWLLSLWLAASVGFVSAQTTTPTVAAPLPPAPTPPATVAADSAISRQAVTLEFEDGFKTKAEIDAPSVGQSPFPAVLMLGGSGATDMDGATPDTPNLKIYKEMLDNLVRRGFIVYKYNKRGLDSGGRVINQKASDERTNDVLVRDGTNALRQLVADARVDKNRVYILAHSQGTLIAPQVAQKAPGTVKALVLTGTIASWPAAFDYQLVTRFIEAAQEADTNKDGLLSSDELSVAANADPKVYANARRNDLLQDSALVFFQVFTRPGQPKTVGPIVPDIDQDKDGKLSIDKELKPVLTAQRDGLLTNRGIIQRSRESAAALKSLLEGPKLVDVLPPLKIPVYFQHGAEDERAPLAPVKEVSSQLTSGGTLNLVRVYPGLGHTFVPVEFQVRLSADQLKALDKAIPDDLLNEQASWIVSRFPAQGGSTPNPSGPTTDPMPNSGLGQATAESEFSWQPIALLLLSGTGGGAFLLIRLERRKRATPNLHG